MPEPASRSRMVFVTGAGGFVGSAVVAQLAASDWRVMALSRQGGAKPSHPFVTAVQGDLLERGSWRDSLSRCSAVIHLVGIIREEPARGVTFHRVHVEATQRIVEAARQAGISRFIHMSALGCRPQARSEYHRTKFAAEQYVRQSGLDWTIFRPSLIHGPDGQFMRLLARWARRWPGLMPYFGKGLSGLYDCGRLQPVYVADVARAFVEAMDRPVAGRIYDLVGQDVLNWPQLYRLVGHTLHRRVMPLPIPAWYGLFLARMLPGRWLPFNRDQVLMAQEDNLGDLAPLAADFGWAPRGISTILSEYSVELLA